MSGLNSLKWWDGEIWRPELQEVNAYAEGAASGKIATNTFLTLSSTSVHAGSSITIFASLVASGLVYPSGEPIQFQERIDGVWTNLGAVVNTNGTGVATTVVTVNSSTTYRATYAGNATYLASTSTAQTCYVQTLVEVVARYYPVWEAVYYDDLSKDTTTFGDNLAQSYSSRASNYSNYLSLIGFDETEIQAFLADAVTKTSVTLSIKVDFGSGATTGYLLWGEHDYTSEPATISMTRVDEELYTSTFAVDDCPIRVTYTSTGTEASDMIDRFAAGTSCGLVIGPAPTTSLSYVLQAYGMNKTNKPYIEFTVEKWL